MSVTVEGQVGPRALADGANDPFRQGRTAELVTVDAYGRYHEPGSRGLIYGGSTALTGVTVAAGMVSPVAAAATPLFGIYNPMSSGILVSILKVIVASVSGTPGAGAFGYNVVAGQNITTGSAGQSASGPSTGKAKFFNGATAMTGGTTAFTLFRPAPGPVNFAAALAASAGPLSSMDEVAGEIVLLPGSVFCVAPPAAGTTWVVVAGASWMETPFLGNS